MSVAAIDKWTCDVARVVRRVSAVTVALSLMSVAYRGHPAAGPVYEGSSKGNIRFSSPKCTVWSVVDIGIVN